MLSRLRWVQIIAIGVCLILAGRMAWVQLVWGPELSQRAADQRYRVYTDPARRGEIQDRSGQQLAYTMQARSLTVSPKNLRKELRYVANADLAKTVDNYYDLSKDEREKRIDQKVLDYLDSYSEDIPRIIAETGASTSEIKSEEIRKKLDADTTYEVLVRNVDPDVAVSISEQHYGIAADIQDIRQYPNGSVASNVIGKISQDGQGQFGFEASNDSLLSGINGQTVVDVSTDGQIIPGTTRDQVAAMNGSDVTLTLDLDLQTYVQQQLEQAKTNSGAKGASAVVLDVETAEVLAMANTDSINPMGDVQKQLDRGKKFGNSTVSEPFEPGSVAKIITAAGVIEDGLSTPDEVLTVPGSIDMAGVNVKDAWDHGPTPYTTTGIFGKSSNVGTLMLAQRLGEERFDSLLTGFGIGQATGIELPSESAGLRPQLEQWSGGTFANLPIGQGMSLTLLQMAGVYQTLANGGERIEPRIVAEIRDNTGEVIEQPAPKKTRVVSESTARTVVDMFRSVVQSDPSGIQQGTGAGAAVEGYQIAGKTGTAQQVDPNTRAYSNSKYWITFAGIAPADNPRFVVALMLDNPTRGVHGEGGQSAAPLFHDIASWLLDRDNVPLSPPMEGQLVLQAQ
ncbi:MAG: penicillin-binding protein 2 [Corynebacterium sp.]|uniref:peptidoglycan D,D-transpeptidase FtsI family protein n=1 Tax=Corynebacterium sp. TaxID=1720 RepID=UPI0026DA8883|nr:penicillin-binding protein 2 [Corynebacterium sp.]MDO5097918.1 penicillin-binding protein 2 [Corynebacterium sp.]